MSKRGRESRGQWVLRCEIAVDKQRERERRWGEAEAAFNLGYLSARLMCESRGQLCKCNVIFIQSLISFLFCSHLSPYAPFLSYASSFHRVPTFGTGYAHNQRHSTLQRKQKNCDYTNNILLPVTDIFPPLILNVIKAYHIVEVQSLSSMLILLESDQISIVCFHCCLTTKTLKYAYQGCN